jgi:hypothetical protein
MRITFDTNIFDKVSRPTIYPENPELQEMIIVHEVLKHREIQGFISDTAITLEGITKSACDGVREHANPQFTRADLRRIPSPSQ